MQAAFYKGTRPGIQGLYNIAVRWWELGKYSHCELVFSDGVSASASYLDGGVRFKRIEYDPAKWDLVDLPEFDEPSARMWFEMHEGRGYDLFGNFHFVVGPIRNDDGKYFCSESIAAALGFADAWRFEPNVLYAVLTHHT